MTKSEKLKTVERILTQAKTHIERGWCRGYYAVDARGACAYTGDPTAVAWCAQGAVFKAYHSDIASIAYTCTSAALASLCCAAKNANLVAWNDAPGRTKDEVVRLYDQAIADVRKQMGSGE